MGIKEHKKMSDLKNFIQDSIQMLHDKPISHGLIPTVLGTGVSFLSVLEVGLRIASVSLAVFIGAITAYIKWQDVKEIKRKRKERK